MVGKFAEVDLHPARVTNTHMGSIFEELIRRFAEASNETAGEHFTPREVIRLMVNLLLTEDRDTLTTPGIVKTLFDPACGTGGMLSVAEEYVRDLNPDARLEVFGQAAADIEPSADPRLRFWPCVNGPFEWGRNPPKEKIDPLVNVVRGLGFRRTKKYSWFNANVNLAVESALWKFERVIERLEGRAGDYVS